MPLGNQSLAYFSIDNSTKIPLHANATFLGTWEDVSQFAVITSLCRMDQLGTLFLEFSIDGSVVDRTLALSMIDVVDGNYASIGPRARYFRARYLNGPIVQNVFRLQHTYSATAADAGHAPINSGVGFKTNSEVTRSVMFGQVNATTYAPFKVASDGTLPITITSSPSILSPILKTNKLSTSVATTDQVILSYTPTSTFYLQGFSSYVWDTMSSSMVVFGEASLESPVGTKLYTSQLTSMGLGKDQVDFSQPLAMPANQVIRVVCSPSAPINSQTWQANLIGTI